MRDASISELLASATGPEPEGDLMAQAMRYQSPLGADLQDSLARARGKTALFVGSRATGVGSTGGYGSDTLGQAMAADESGVPREQIWTDMGWFKGVDGRWRREIPDDTMKITTAPIRGQTAPRPLNEAVQHPYLYNNYPGRGQNFRTFVYDDTENAAQHGYEGRASNGQRSGYDTDTGTIRMEGTNGSLGLNLAPRAGDTPATYDARMKDTLIHEIQHAVQGEEGFDGGGSPDPRKGAFAPGTMTLLSPYETYHRLTGEVEARTVEKRRALTPEQRKARPPWLDYDVPEGQQIRPQDVMDLKPPAARR